MLWDWKGVLSRGCWDANGLPRKRTRCPPGIPDFSGSEQRAPASDRQLSRLPAPSITRESRAAMQEEGMVFCSFVNTEYLYYNDYNAPQNPIRIIEAPVPILHKEDLKPRYFCFAGPFHACAFAELPRSLPCGSLINCRAEGKNSSILSMNLWLLAPWDFRLRTSYDLIVLLHLIPYQRSSTQHFS